MTGINDKQARFVEEYLVDLNATQAAIRAGYSERTAYSQGQRLLKNVEVAAAIAAGQAKLAAKLEITQERVRDELAKIAFANMGDYIAITPDGDAYVDLSDLTPEQSAAIGEITVEDYKDGRGEDARDVRRVKFKLNDKKAALDSLMRHLGGFKDKVEVDTGENLAALIAARRAKMMKGES